MRRIAMFAGIFALGLLLGSILEAQTPGSLVVRGEYITVTGCMAFLNDAQVLKKQGVCSFAIVAPGVKMTDLACSSVIFTYEDPTTSAAGHDTVINCTYSPVKKLSANPSTPKLKEGTMQLPVQDTVALSDGCFADLNHPALRCGFNVVLVGLAIPNLTLTTTISGGNTTIEGTYPPMKVTQ